MSTSIGLSMVLAAFVALMTTVLTVAMRERRAGKRIEASDAASQAASDGRVMVVVFGSIIGGMLLMVVTAVLVFF